MVSIVISMQTDNLGYLPRYDVGSWVWKQWLKKIKNKIIYIIGDQNNSDRGTNLTIKLFKLALPFSKVSGRRNQ